MFCSPSQPIWDLIIHPLQGPASWLTLDLFSNRCGTLQSTSFLGPVSLLAHRLLSTPFRGSTFSLTHRPVSGSDTIWNSPKPTASRYCPLWVFPFELPLKVFKMHLLGRGFHTRVKNISFSSPNDVGSHNSSPSGEKTKQN